MHVVLLSEFKKISNTLIKPVKQTRMTKHLLRCYQSVYLCVYLAFISRSRWQQNVNLVKHARQMATSAKNLTHFFQKHRPPCGGRWAGALQDPLVRSSISCIDVQPTTNKTQSNNRDECLPVTLRALLDLWGQLKLTLTVKSSMALWNELKREGY